MIMNKSYIMEKLVRIFRENFDDDSIELSEASTWDDVEGWDSLEHIKLIVAMQDEFQLQFNIEEIESMKSVGDMVHIISEKIRE